MVQIELEEQYLEKVDRLIKAGIVGSRQEALNVVIGNLLELSEEELEKMKQVQRTVNSYCDAHLGNMLGGGIPIRVIVDYKEYFKVPVRGEYEGQVYTYGYIFVDAENLTINEHLSDSREKIHKTAEQLTGYDGTII